MLAKIDLSFTQITDRPPYNSKYFKWSGWKGKAIHDEIRKLKSTHMALLWWPWSCFLFDCAAESACKGPQRSKPFLLGSIKSWPNWSSNGLVLLADGLHPIAAQIDERWTSKYTTALCKKFPGAASKIWPSSFCLYALLIVQYI